jgi:hypothetical protein
MKKFYVHHGVMDAWVNALMNGSLELGFNFGHSKIPS